MLKEITIRALSNHEHNTQLIKLFETHSNLEFPEIYRLYYDAGFTTGVAFPHPEDFGNTRLRDIIRKRYNRWKASRSTPLACSTVMDKAVTTMLTEEVETLDSKSVCLKNTRICTLDQLIEHCKIDLSVWEVARFECNKWEVGTKVDDEIAVAPLYQVKASFKKKTTSRFDALKDIITTLSKTTFPIPEFKKPVILSNRMIEIPLVDLHVGKLAVEAISGADYNRDIARNLAVEAVSDVLNKAKAMNPEKVLLVLGNDFFHIDTMLNTTTKGTHVETDGLYQQVFSDGLKLMVEITNLCLSEVGKVDVIFIPGNHDHVSTFFAMQFLEAWYRNTPEVNIITSNKTRQYYHYGVNLIGFAHGDDTKLQDLPLIMAQEVPEAWSKTKYREFHTGHLHHKKTYHTKDNEYMGVRVRVLTTVSATDSWHQRLGYIGSIRSLEAYVWDAEKGLAGILVYNV